MPRAFTVDFGGGDTSVVQLDDNDAAELQAALTRLSATEPDITESKLVARIGLKVLRGWATEQRAQREAAWQTRMAEALGRLSNTADKEAFVSTVEVMAPEPE
jgi:hypothetical protein